MNPKLSWSLFVLACLMLASTAFGSAHALINAENKAKKWQGTCDIGPSSGNCAAGSVSSISINCPVGAGATVTIGGKNGACGTSKCWLKNCSGEWVCTADDGDTDDKRSTKEKRTAAFFDFGTMDVEVDTIVTVPIWSTVNSDDTVAIFQSFVAPVRPPLVTNVRFDFGGYDDEGDPILLHKTTGVPITDNNGVLYPEFSYTGKLVASGYIKMIPEADNSNPRRPAREDTEKK